MVAPMLQADPMKPLEVVKTTMAANRGDSFAGAMSRITGRGGVLGCTLALRDDAPYAYIQKACLPTKTWKKTQSDTRQKQKELC